MPLPTLDKTWQFSVNNRIAADSTTTGGANDGTNDRKNLLLGIKNALIGFASNPWTVSGSSGAVAGTGAMDSVDRWTSISEMLSTATTSTDRSWIVLTQSAVGIHLLIDWVGFGSHRGSGIDIFVSTAAFTGGALNARPTAR